MHGTFLPTTKVLGNKKKMAGEKSYLYTFELPRNDMNTYMIRQKLY